MGQYWVFADLILMKGCTSLGKLGAGLWNDFDLLLELMRNQVEFPDPPTLGPSRFGQGTALDAVK
jgi:hypothetical protein